MKKTVRVECPYCKATMYVDACSGEVVEKWQKLAKDPSRDQLAEALQKISREKENRQVKFQKAQSELTEKKQKIEEAFKKQLKKVKEEGEQGRPPLKPIDLD
ncbi:MAG: hypothetical protein ABII27_06425 [bacterium]